MPPQKPVPIPVQYAVNKIPQTGSVGDPRRWTFSFQFFKQIAYFGLSKSKSKWFASLLERLAELSKYEIDKFESDHQLKDEWRYHIIKWNQKNIPIQRSQLDWLPSDYRDNEDEYPLFQVMVSQALGRIVGFWDERRVFNIVLLDPLHNIQPSKAYNYHIDDCSPLSCMYTSLMGKIEDAASATCGNQECPKAELLSKRHLKTEKYEAIFMRVPTDTYTEIERLLENGTIASLESILDSVVLLAMDGGN